MVHPVVCVVIVSSCGLYAGELPGSKKRMQGLKNERISGEKAIERRKLAKFQISDGTKIKFDGPANHPRAWSLHPSNPTIYLIFRTIGPCLVSFADSQMAVNAAPKLHIHYFFDHEPVF